MWSGYVYPVFLFCAISAAKELEGFGDGCQACFIYAEEKVHKHQVVVVLIRKFVSFADEIEVGYYCYVARDLFLFICLRKVVKHGVLWMEFLEWKLAPCFQFWRYMALNV